MIYSIVWIHTIVYCSLWVSTPPTQTDWQTYCPAFNFGWGAMPAIDGLADVDTWLFMRAIEISSGQVVCDTPAFHSLGTLPCPDLQPLDAYTLQLVQPEAEYLVCTVMADLPPDPLTACPSLPDYLPPGAVFELRGPWPVQAAPAPTAVTPPRPDFTVPLATADELDHLSYWLRWYDLGDPVVWQNQWDQSILGSAHVTNVPPALLKAVLGQESQFWPMWTGDAGEVGLIQLTWDGADTALRHSPALYADYCPLAIWPPYCSRAYDNLPIWQREHIAAALISDLTLSGPPLDRAAQVGMDMLTYARILAAYYSYSAALGFEGWDFALAAFNAGGTCLRTGSICPQGQAYLKKVMP